MFVPRSIEAGSMCPFHQTKKRPPIAAKSPARPNATTTAAGSALPSASPASAKKAAVAAKIELRATLG